MKIGIELYRNAAGNRQGLQLDVACLIMRLERDFPGIHFEEEYFQKHVERIQTILKGAKDSPALSMAINDAEERGPGFRFFVDSAEGEPLRGSLSRYGLSFLFDDRVEEALITKAKRFVDTFAINRVENEAVE